MLQLVLVECSLVDALPQTACILAHCLALAGLFDGFLVLTFLDLTVDVADRRHGAQRGLLTFLFGVAHAAGFELFERNTMLFVGQVEVFTGFA